LRTNGPMRTSPSMRCDSSAAAQTAAPALIELPMRTAGWRRCSIRASASVPAATSSYAANVASLSPWPRRSIVATRKPAWTSAGRVCRYELRSSPIPDIHTTRGPSPPTRSYAIRPVHHRLSHDQSSLRGPATDAATGLVASTTSWPLSSSDQGLTGLLGGGAADVSRPPIQLSAVWSASARRTVHRPLRRK